MIAVVRSELYRALTVRSSWVSVTVFVGLGLLLGWFSPDMWSLQVGFGTFVIAIMSTAKHYQHRTAVLLFLGQPHRVSALTGQAIGAIAVTLAAAFVSGATVLVAGNATHFIATLMVVPLMAVLGVANATIVRRPTWLFIGYSGWLIFVEGLLGELKQPLPFSAFLHAGAGDRRNLLIFVGWTVLASAGAIAAVHRDLTGD